MFIGIDVSQWQGSINWPLVKTQIDFAILRAGGSDGSYFRDKYFEYNFAECKKHNIPVGCYYIVGKQCNNGTSGMNDANHFYQLIKGKQFEYPVVIDFELPTPATKQGNTDAVIMFCEFMENLKYYVSIYASDISGFKDKLDITRLTAYDKWVARYGSKPKYVQTFGIWQTSSKGNLNGVKGFVDTDLSYNNYPAIMAKHHLNGF